MALLAGLCLPAVEKGCTSKEGCQKSHKVESCKSMKDFSDFCRCRVYLASLFHNKINP